MAKEKTPLQQTRGTWRAVGIVNRISADKAYTEGTFDKGKNVGKEWRSLRFSVKTTEQNELWVELFGMEKDAYISQNLKKEELEKLKKQGKKRPTKKLSFENRDNIPEGWSLIGINIGKFEDDEADKKKIVYETFVDYDAVDEIFQTFDDGDSISVSGDLTLSEYENQQGEKVKQAKYQIKYASKLVKPIDFNDEKFEETASFEQEIVFVGSTYDKQTKKLHVIGRTIAHDETWFDFPFVINMENPSVKDVGSAFNSKLKFGDFVKVMGICLNKVEQVEVKEEDNVKDSIFGDGGHVPKGQGKRANTHRTTELQITAVETKSFLPKRYKAEDFVIQEELVNEDVDKENPFINGDSEDSDDDMPFN